MAKKTDGKVKFPTWAEMFRSAPKGLTDDYRRRLRRKQLTARDVLTLQERWHDHVSVVMTDLEQKLRGGELDPVTAGEYLGAARDHLLQAMRADVTALCDRALRRAR